MQDLPLNGRNFVQLATLSPGVSGAGSGMRGTIMSGTRPDDLRPGTELFVNGNRENSNNYLYDGIDNNTRLTLVIVMRPNVEAIQEFKVQTNLFSAEQGRNPGGQVNVVTKSGGNEIHGSVYEFLRNDRFDANNFFANRAGQEKPPFKQNQFGGRDRRADHQEQDVLLRRLRRVPPGAGARVRQHRADAEDAAGRLQRAVGADLRPADDGGAARRRASRASRSPATSFRRPLGPGDGQADERLPGADLVGAVQQPGHDADAHAGLEPVRRAHRSHAEPGEQLPRALFAGRRPTTTNPYTFPAVAAARAARKPSASGNEDTFAGTSALVAQHAVLGWVHVFSPRLVLDSRVGYNRFDLDFTQADVEVGRPARRAARRAQRQPAG